MTDTINTPCDLGLVNTDNSFVELIREHLPHVNILQREADTNDISGMDCPVSAHVERDGDVYSLTIGTPGRIPRTMDNLTDGQVVRILVVCTTKGTIPGGIGSDEKQVNHLSVSEIMAVVPDDELHKGIADICDYLHEEVGIPVAIETAHYADPSLIREHVDAGGISFSVEKNKRGYVLCIVGPRLHRTKTVCADWDDIESAIQDYLIADWEYWAIGDTSTVKARVSSYTDNYFTLPPLKPHDLKKKKVDKEQKNDVVAESAVRRYIVFCDQAFAFGDAPLSDIADMFQHPNIAFIGTLYNEHIVNEVISNGDVSIEYYCSLSRIVVKSKTNEFEYGGVTPTNLCSEILNIVKTLTTTI